MKHYNYWNPTFFFCYCCFTVFTVIKNNKKEKEFNFLSPNISKSELADLLPQ